MSNVTAMKFQVSSAGSVSALLQEPPDASALLVLGHGSGSDMHVPLMVGLANALEAEGVATLRFEFPYSDRSDFVPYSNMPVDSDEVLVATVRAAVECATQLAIGVPIFVGGHSLSAHIATIADAQTTLSASGVVSLGFPRKGDASRSAHLARTTLPILFVQGTNDSLGSTDEIGEMVGALGQRASLEWIRGASHGFTVVGRDDADVMNEVAVLISDYTRK